LISLSHVQRFGFQIYVLMNTYLTGVGEVQLFINSIVNNKLDYSFWDPDRMLVSQNKI